ncbi:MAG TPA: malto-oligosyltrehalose synthase [Fimbriiglobus sp.]|nr:malto-oligosyltrehalose synthase [Fimbriiglobus sp.]
MDADTLAAAAMRVARDRRRAPSATYRHQMHAGFTFRDAAAVLPYLDSLGISHLYLSPVLAARAGSTHGYDVIDPTSLNPEVGTEDDFRALVAACRGRGMGVVLDVVPNHMYLGPANPWWRDVFEHGPSSPYAGYFDIAWDDPLREELRGRVVLPILGAPYHEVLESGELTLDLENGALLVRLYESALPVDPRTYDHVLKPALDRLAESPSEAVAELQSVLTAVRHLPPRTEADPERVREGRAEAEVIKRRIAAVVEADPAVAAAVRAAIDEFRTPEASARLDALLEAQAYRLCYWRVASDEINYRRFFDINELSALSAEREDVFRDTHALILRLCGEGLVDGLRIDHPDGLYDPKQYLQRLQEYYLLAVARHLAATDPAFAGVEWGEVEPAVRERLGPTPHGGREQRQDEPLSPSPLGGAGRGGGYGASTGRGHHSAPVERTPHPNPPPQGGREKESGLPLYVIVEKILERTEHLPPDWPAASTTGYEFINAINGLFVDPAGAASLSRAYEALTGRDDPFPEVALRAKIQVLHSAFSSELDMLARQLDRLARVNRLARDFTLNGQRGALRAVIASFPVYRSYVDGHVSRTDERLIRLAVLRARRRSPTLSQDLFDFIRDTLLLRDPPTDVPGEYAEDQRRFAGKFQQVTAPVTAKGVEDTAFYRFNRLVSLNEVGGDPGWVGWPVIDVHAYLADRQARHPLGLSAGSTHDTKRGEDVRARIDVLSELPDEWAERARRWADLNRPHRVELDDGFSAPDPNDEYLLYQTLVGAWPADAGEPDRFADRIKQYMSKATHEAKEHTSWINPNPEYDAAVRAFVARVLDPNQSAVFLADLNEFARRVARFGAVNSLAQALVRCTAPGVPDTYQGTELLDLNLVDPDNRRPVDYRLRESLLRALDREAEGTAGLNLSPFDRRAKLHVVSLALRLRRSAPELFGTGDYLPVAAAGAKAEHVFAFARRTADRAVLVVVPRLVVGLTGGGDRPPLGAEVWADTRLELPESADGEAWVDRLTGERLTVSGAGLAVGRVLSRFPVSLLERQ